METMIVVGLAAALAWLSRTDSADVAQDRDWDAWAADIAAGDRRP